MSEDDLIQAYQAHQLSKKPAQQQQVHKRR